MADMEAVQVISTPPYSSNEPEVSEALRMIPVDDNPPHEGWGDAESAGEMKAADWVVAIEGAADQDALDEILSAYGETGKEYSTVTAAAEKKQEELDADDEN